MPDSPVCPAGSVCPVYFDNSATTPLCSMAKNAFLDASATGGNPSSLHRMGAAAAALLESARGDIAAALRARPEQVYFTGGGTEANNLALLGAAGARARLGRRVVSTAVEHASVREPLKMLEKQGFEVLFLSPGPDGRFSETEVLEAVNGDTVLVSVIHTNNETGAYSPLPLFRRAADDAAKSAKKRPLLHCDAVQAFGKEKLDPAQWGVDLLSVSAHKVFGPKGIGALYLGPHAKIRPLTYGGGQERALRPGTEPVELACAFAAAARDFGSLPENRAAVTAVRDTVLHGLSRLERETGYALPVLSPADGSPYILSFSAGGVRSETMLHFLEAEGIYVSGGSACSKGKSSRVLAAMGVPRSIADSALRLSFSKHNTAEEAERFLSALRRGLETLARPR